MFCLRNKENNSPIPTLIWRPGYIVLGLCEFVCATNLNFSNNMKYYTWSFDISYVHTLWEELFKYTKVYDLDLRPTFDIVAKK